MSKFNLKQPAKYPGAIILTLCAAIWIYVALGGKGGLMGGIIIAIIAVIIVIIAAIFVILIYPIFKVPYPPQIKNYLSSVKSKRFNMKYNSAKRLIEFFKKYDVFFKKEPERQALLRKMYTERGKKLGERTIKWFKKRDSKRLERAKKAMMDILAEMKKIDPQSPQIIEIENEFAEMKKILHIE